MLSEDELKEFRNSPPAKRSTTWEKLKGNIVMLPCDKDSRESWLVVEAEPGGVWMIRWQEFKNLSAVGEENQVEHVFWPFCSLKDARVPGVRAENNSVPHVGLVGKSKPRGL